MTTVEASTITLPRGYSARPPTLEDAGAVANLIATCQTADGAEPDVTEEEVRGDWQTLDLASEALLVTADGGDLVACVDILNRNYLQVYVYGYAHPDQRGRGLGRYLVDWGEEWAREHMLNAPAGARIDVRHYINANNEGGRSLLESRGYPAVRGVYVMAMELDQAPPQPAWPAGIVARRLVAGADDELGYEVVEEAFRDHWGRTPNTLENFKNFTSKDNFGGGWVAEDEGKVAGVVFLELGSDSGWIGTIGVRRPWRRRGLALALLHATFNDIYRKGLRLVKLSVDSESPTNAPGLYKRAGMEVKENFIVYQRAIRPGKDYTTLALATDQGERD